MYFLASLSSLAFGNGVGFFGERKSRRCAVKRDSDLAEEQRDWRDVKR